MAETSIWTYQDAVEHVLDLYDLERTGRNLRLARKAVLTAYDGVPESHRWSYLTRRLQVVTEASQSLTGSYDHTGGAEERLVTATVGTFPDSARLGHIILDDQIYEVEDRLSSTTVTLSPSSNPGTDVASGAITWFKATYTLPVNFRQCYELRELSNAYELEYVTPPDLLDRMMGNFQPARPYCYTIRNASDWYGALEVEFCPPPSESRTYDAVAYIAPRELSVESYGTGLVSVASGSTTVTGTGTSWSSAYVGAIIRFSENGTQPPSSVVGSPNADYPGGVDNPYYAQRVVLDVASATSMTIDAEVSSAVSLTDVKYCISDPLDIEPNSMLTYFWRKAEAEFARLVRAEDYLMREKMAQQELLTAAGSDNRNIDIGRSPSPRWRYYSKLSDWAIIR